MGAEFSRSHRLHSRALALILLLLADGSLNLVGAKLGQHGRAGLGRGPPKVLSKSSASWPIIVSGRTSWME